MEVGYGVGQGWHWLCTECSWLNSKGAKLRSNDENDVRTLTLQLREKYTLASTLTLIGISGIEDPKKFVQPSQMQYFNMAHSY